jgi:TonB family protein
VARFVAAAAGKADRSDGLAPEGVKDRAATLLSRNRSASGPGVLRGLATISATALLSVCLGPSAGIMDSFIGISKNNTTNLAVVAPGIAEALLATAMGFIAAIPAAASHWRSSRGGGLELEQTLPEAARARAKQGTVRLALTIDRSGMSCRHGSGSSGSAALDPTALDIARHASGRHCRRKWDQASVSGAN